VGPSQAFAFPQVGEIGEGAGQSSGPSGVAVDSESELLYVADKGNLRIDVFDAKTGSFKFAFGWKIDKEEPKEELQTCTTGCQKGSEGSGAGQFKALESIAVDNNPASSSHHDIYVFDGGGNTRVEKFSPAGTLLTQFGSSGECQLAAEFEGTHQVTIGPGGVVYVGNVSLVVKGRESEGFKVQAEKFEPSGACAKKIQLAEFAPSEYAGIVGAAQHLWLAIDSGGNIYASFFSNGGAPVRKFDSSGTLLGTVGTSPGGFTAGGALAVNPADDIFLASGTTIEDFDSSGNELRVFGYGTLIVGAGGVAPFHSASGELFLAERQGGQGSGRTLYLPFPKAGPIVLPEVGKTKAEPVGNTKATLNARVNPEGKATKYRFEYVDESTCEADIESEGAGHCFDHAKTTAETPIPIDLEHEEEELFKVHKVSLQIGCSEPSPQKVEAGECLEPETKYRFRVFGKNADGEGEGPVEGEPFETREAIEIIATWAGPVGAETATLSAEVNPFGIPANGRFQYIPEGPDFQEHGFEHALQSGPIDLGEGEEATTRSIEVEGLQPDTTYRYRLVASDLFVEEALSEPHTLHTFPVVSEGSLPDGRNYEMVSPAAKNSGEAGVPTPSGGAAEFSVEPQQAAADGTGITYGSFAAFGSRPESAPATGQYLSSLGPPFWSTENINPRFEEGFARDPFVGFSEDLSHAAVIAIEPALTEDATVGFPNLYVRDDETGLLTAITTKAHEPELGKTVKHSDYCLAYGGASADFGRLVFAAFGGALDEGDPKGEGFNLYEWSLTGGIKLASVLPNGKAAAPKVGTAFGSLSGERFCNPATELMRHAVSTDGQRIFWTQEGASSGEEKLFARVNGTETLRLDEPNEGVGGTGGKGRYWDASTDGSTVFFTDTEKLTADAGAALGKPDLYRYDLEAPLHHRLTDLTPAGSEAANVAGVVGASEDGSYLYFGAGGNLYAWHEGETRLITTAANATDWSSNPATQSARVTPDGRHLAFLSTSAPTGYDNEVSAGGHCQLAKLGEGALVGSPKCAEAYLYSFEGEQLICASCDPSGARPLGPTRLPAWSTPYQQPRYLSDDGSRLFFDTLDALSPRDSDERRDVYEFERLGSGGCEESSPAFSPASGGCLHLISSGQKSGPTSDESYLLDASSSGDGVFFSTRQRMLPTDADERYDVYDARVGGVLPPPPPPICEGACLNGATSPAEALPAGTSPFQAPRQKPSRECPKGTHRAHRKGKAHCVKPKKHRRSHRKGGRR